MKVRSTRRPGATHYFAGATPRDIIRDVKMMSNFTRAKPPEAFSSQTSVVGAAAKHLLPRDPEGGSKHVT